MLQAMNTGHEGSLTTVHANSPRDALARIENMVSMANLNIPERAVRQQISSAVHAVIQIARLSDGTRKVITISEIVGMNNDAIALQDIFVFDRIGIDENGRVRGTFKATGVRPRFVERLATSGAILRQALSLIPSGGLTKSYADCLSQPSRPSPDHKTSSARSKSITCSQNFFQL